VLRLPARGAREGDGEERAHCNQDAASDLHGASSGSLRTRLAPIGGHAGKLSGDPWVGDKTADSPTSKAVGGNRAAVSDAWGRSP